MIVNTDPELPCPTEREASRFAFLREAGWDNSEVSALRDDASSRCYFRVQKNGRAVILMQSFPDDDPQSIAGHKLSDFVRVAEYLENIGVRVPEIYEKDLANGCLLIEDFGDTTFKRALRSGADDMELYKAATEVLSHIRQVKAEPPFELPHYFESYIHKAHRRIVDWYIPAVTGRQNPDGLVEEYLGIWHGIENELSVAPEGFSHVDFHAENLMWLPHEKGMDRCGVLDFQGAMIGPYAYDAANLLEDARMTVPQEIRSAMMSYYTRNMTNDERDLFSKWARLLAVQFHCRVLGQFVKLAIEKQKIQYLAHVPRILGYMERRLNHPLMHNLARWFSDQGLTFEPQSIDLDRAREIVRDDAF